MNGLEISCLVYLGIGLLITMYVIRDKSFTEGTKWYEKVLGLAFMIILWPIVLCVRSPGDMRMSAKIARGRARFSFSLKHYMGTSLMAGHNWNRPICGAWAKSQKRSCMRKVGLRRNGSLHVVCPSHGSKTPPYSERPISAAGKARIGAAARAMWQRYRSLKSQGLPTWQVGRPKKPAATPRALALTPTDTAERRARAIAELKRLLPDRDWD
jgi:hypothetical protein